MSDPSAAVPAVDPLFTPKCATTYLRLQQLFRYLPVPLVGSVAFNGAKETKHCTNAGYRAFEELFELVQPKHILEIGTHAGHSAGLMLALSGVASRVVSVDIGTVWIGAQASFADWGCASEEGGLLYVQQVLRAHYGEDRFKLIIGDSTGFQVLEHLIAQHRQHGPFDMAFIDGNHAEPYVLRDIETALHLGIKWIVADDFNGADRLDVWRAAQATKLELVREWPAIHSGGAGFALLKAPAAVVP